MTDGQTDRRTDGRIDRILLAILRLHYMQRGKNHRNKNQTNNTLCDNSNYKFLYAIWPGLHDVKYSAYLQVFYCKPVIMQRLLTDANWNMAKGLGVTTRPIHQPGHVLFIAPAAGRRTRSTEKCNSSPATPDTAGNIWPPSCAVGGRPVSPHLGLSSQASCTTSGLTKFPRRCTRWLIR